MRRKLIAPALIYFAAIVIPFLIGFLAHSKLSNRSNPEVALSKNDSLTTFRIDKYLIDLGPIKLDTAPVIAQYSIINEGAHMLCVKSIEPDCRCTAALLSTDKCVPNGDSLLVKLKFLPHSPGVFQVSTLVRLNSTETATLVLRGNVCKQ